MHRIALRRSFVAAVASALFVFSAAAQERVVNVYNWSDYVDASVLEDFTKETGIRVRYDVFDSNDVLQTRMLAGKTGYDVVVPSQTYLQRLISAGVLQKLDKAKLPNLKHAWPDIAARLATYDPGNEYAVNYMWGTTGLGINVPRVKERLGAQALDTWDLVFKPELLVKLRDCGVYMLDAPDELIPAALHFLGLDPDSKDVKLIEKASELFAKIRPAIRRFHSSEYINALATGEICFTVGWSGDVLQARDRAREAAERAGRKPLEIAYVLPKEGALMWFDSFAIPADAPNVENAHAFIDFMMRPEIAARNSNSVAFASGNLAAQKFIDKELLEDPSVYPDTETLKRHYVTTPYPQNVQRVVNRVWTRFRTGR
jgi:putrescine transport system substrate-binding protein